MLFVLFAKTVISTDFFFYNTILHRMRCHLSISHRCGTFPIYPMTGCEELKSLLYRKLLIARVLQQTVLQAQQQCICSDRRQLLAWTCGLITHQWQKRIRNALSSDDLAQFHLKGIHFLCYETVRSDLFLVHNPNHSKLELLHFNSTFPIQPKTLVRSTQEDSESVCVSCLNQTDCRF